MREEPRVGHACLETVTSLLQRARTAHPIDGLYEAADFQWWWRTPRSTDSIDQLFWFDDGGEPIAGVVTTDWSDWVSLNPLFLPDATPDVVAQVVERGLQHAHDCGFANAVLEVSEADAVLRDLLLARGFEIQEAGFLIESWITAEDRPAVSQLHDGYRLSSRSETADRPHYGIARNGPDVAERLRETSLYRPDLDLVILDDQDNYAAHAIFWHDPQTATGLVEPVRTEEAHQRRGLARHLVAAGVDKLAAAGAERIKICFEPSNPGSSHLYLSLGFEPVKRTDLISGPTAKP